jgi:hypothetical protein
MESMRGRDRRAGVRRMAALGLTGLAIGALGGGSALADSPVERSTPFSDYRQAVADQYAIPSAPQPGRPQSGAAPTPPSDLRGAHTHDDAPGAASSPAGQATRDVAVGGGGDEHLPFTGLDLTTLVLLGLLLVGLGALVRAAQRLRLARS